MDAQYKPYFEEFNGSKDRLDMKALLIAPIFFGYELTVKSGLEKRHYEVDFMDSEQLKPEYWSCWKKDFIHKVFRHTIPGQREIKRQKKGRCHIRDEIS